MVLVKASIKINVIFARAILATILYDDNFSTTYDKYTDLKPHIYFIYLYYNKLIIHECANVNCKFKIF